MASSLSLPPLTRGSFPPAQVRILAGTWGGAETRRPRQRLLPAARYLPAATFFVRMLLFLNFRHEIPAMLQQHDSGWLNNYNISLVFYTVFWMGSRVSWILGVRISIHHIIYRVDSTVNFFHRFLFLSGKNIYFLKFSLFKKSLFVHRDSLKTRKYQRLPLYQTMVSD